MDELREDFTQGRKWLRFSLEAAFLWGLLTHAYAFLNNAISHDSMREFHAAVEGNNIKMSAGRIFVPLYRDLLRSDATLSWLIGMLSIFWIGLAVFLVIRMFRIESKGLAFLTAGILSANITVAATAATYIHDLDCNMFSMLLSVGAVYLWRRLRYGWMWGGILLMVSLGLYQSFFVCDDIIGNDAVHVGSSADHDISKGRCEWYACHRHGNHWWNALFCGVKAGTAYYGYSTFFWNV